MVSLSLRRWQLVRETSQCRGNGNPRSQICKRVAPVAPEGQRCEETCLLDGGGGGVLERPSVVCTAAEHRA